MTTAILGRCHDAFALSDALAGNLLHVLRDGVRPGLDRFGLRFVRWPGAAGTDRRPVVAALRAEADAGDDEGMAALPFALLNPIIRDNAGFDKQSVSFPRMPRDASGYVPEREEPKTCDGPTCYIAIGGLGDFILADEAEAGECDLTACT
jgi:hypothetical protein